MRRVKQRVVMTGKVRALSLQQYSSTRLLLGFVIVYPYAHPGTAVGSWPDNPFEKVDHWTILEPKRRFSCTPAEIWGTENIIHDQVNREWYALRSALASQLPDAAQYLKRFLKHVPDFENHDVLRYYVRRCFTFREEFMKHPPKDHLCSTPENGDEEITLIRARWDYGFGMNCNVDEWLIKEGGLKKLLSGEWTCIVGRSLPHWFILHMCLYPGRAVGVYYRSPALGHITSGDAGGQR